MNRIRIGTCSWQYPSWAGLVYSAEKGIDYLAEYAAVYDCVEVDRWFWSLFEPGQLKLPDPRDARAYREAVPESFRFAVKAPNSLTLPFHHRRKKDAPSVANPHFLSSELAEDFLARLEPLCDVLGPILFQFEYLNRQKMPSRQAFEDALAAFARTLPTGYTYGVEIRNARWLDAAFLDLLRDMGLIPVLISGYWMPRLPDLLAQHMTRLTSFDSVVLRLMGQDRAAIEKRTQKVWNRLVDPHDSELDSVADAVRSLAQTGPTPFLFINNHYEGAAPLTIERIRARLGIGERSA